jgi:four helix bundle protein
LVTGFWLLEKWFVMGRWTVKKNTNFSNGHRDNSAKFEIMNNSSNFKDLRVWQQSMDLAKSVYLISKQIPDEERFGLTQQIRRAAVGVPSNIAEGQARGTKEFLHFLNISKGSLSEVETQLILARNLEFISNEDCSEILIQIESLQRQLNALTSSLKLKFKKTPSNKV